MTYSKCLTNRTQKLQKWLEEKKIEGCIIQDPVNLFYYTGLHLSAGILLITPKKGQLIIDHRYAARCQREAPFEVIATMSYPETLKKMKFPSKVVVDGQVLTHSNYQKLARLTKLKSIPGFLATLRMLKDEDEAKKIEKSCAITSRGYTYIRKLLKEGVTEREIALKLENFFKKEGAEKVSFDIIVAFGKNSANPHYSPQKVKLKKNDVVLIDSGCIFEGYCSDMTRTYLIGNVSKKMEKLYHLVEEVQKEAVKLCVPGNSMKSVDDYVNRFFEEHGVDDLFIHSLGHGVGVEIHELPTYTTKGVFEPGMVVTVEPGLYIDGLGGVRIEDTLLITESGHKNLTR